MVFAVVVLMSQKLVCLRLRSEAGIDGLFVSGIWWVCLEELYFVLRTLSAFLMCVGSYCCVFFCFHHLSKSGKV